MTHAELMGIAGLVLMAILFVFFVLGMRRRGLFLILMNGLISMFIYYVLLMTSAISLSKLHPLMVGSMGLLYLIALLFM